MIIYPDMPSVSPIYPVTSHLPWYVKTWRFLTVPTFWDMTDDYVYLLDDGTAILLPYQFRFDGASLPRIVWPLITPTGCLFIPGGFHDCWYRFGCLLKIKNLVELVEMKRAGVYAEKIRSAMLLERYHDNSPRNEADKMFQRIGNEITDLRLVNWVAYVSLEQFGWIAWNNWRRKDEEARNQIELWLNGGQHAGQPQSGDGTSKEASTSLYPVQS